jgi:hypothetical protein
MMSASSLGCVIIGVMSAATPLFSRKRKSIGGLAMSQECGPRRYLPLLNLRPAVVPNLAAGATTLPVASRRLWKACVHVCRSAQIAYFLASGSQNFCSSSMKRVNSAP